MEVSKERSSGHVADRAVISQPADLLLEVFPIGGHHVMSSVSASLVGPHSSCVNNQD